MRNLPYYNLEIQRRNGHSLLIDHSFKITKHIQSIGDSKVFLGLFSALNEIGEVRMFQFIHSTSLEEVRMSMENCYKTMCQYNKVPGHVYTDRCCTDRACLETAFPSLKIGMAVSKMKALPLPPEEYIQILTSPEAVNGAMKLIYDELERRRENLLVALDCEWMCIPSRRPIAMIQIAVDDPAISKKVTKKLIIITNP
jgi:hypothetical protein